MDAPRLLRTQERELAIQPLKFWENWRTVGYMFRNYPIGLDVAWDAEVRGIFSRLYKRYIDIPLYMALKNEGYALRLGREIAGLLYLQHPLLVTHINDIEINAAYRGQGYSRLLLDFAEDRARQLRKKFMTLAVTLSNKRAFNIYLRNGYREQHDRFYQLNRQWWSEPASGPLLARPITTQHYSKETANRRIGLQALKRREADRNLLHFFKLETVATNPAVSPVWLQHYLPLLPPAAKGRSYGLTLGLTQTTFCGHVDLFDNGEWSRWRVFLDPTAWDNHDLKVLVELLLNEVSDYNTVTLAFGSTDLHEQAKPLVHEWGLQERYSERTLMIKIL